MAADESPSSKKEPPWPSILPPMPRISVSTASRARLSHRRPVLLSPPTPPAAASVDVNFVAPSPPSQSSPKSTHKFSEFPVLETLPAHDSAAHFPPSTHKSPESSLLETLPAHESIAPFPPSCASPTPAATATATEGGGEGVVAALPISPFSPKSTHKSSEFPVLETLSAHDSPSSPCCPASARRAFGGGEGEGSRAAFSFAGLDGGDTAAAATFCDEVSKLGKVGSLSNRDSSGNLSSLCVYCEFITSANSEECTPVNGILGPPALQQASSSEGGHPGVQNKNGVGFGMSSGDELNKGNNPDLGGLSRDRCTSSDIQFTVAEPTSLGGLLHELEEGHEYGGAGIQLSGENCLEICREAETSDLVRGEEVVKDEGELEEGQHPVDVGNEPKVLDSGRSSKDGCTSSVMEITIAKSMSSAGCPNALQEVDGSIRVNYEHCLEIGRDAEMSDLVNTEELVVDEGELEEGQLSGEWSGGEESQDDSEPDQMLEDTAADCPDVRGVPSSPMAFNEPNQNHYPFQVEGIQSEQRSGGNSKAKSKKKKKHKKGEGSKKRSREKSKEKYKEVLKKRRAEGNGSDLGSNLGKDSKGRGDQAGNNNDTGKFNKVPENLSRALPPKPTVDEGPEDGEILLESTKTNDGILSSLVEAEVGLWTTDDVDDQFVAEMEQDGAVKKKRGPETAERKLKRKIAKRKKRAQKERELGIRRPPRTVQSKPVKVLCTHYMKGRCAKGDQCTFSHDAVPLTKQEPCKFLMSHSCLKGDDCPYSHDLRAFPCKFFHTRGLCYDGENCQFSHGAISEEALTKLKQRVEKEKKERVSSTSGLDIPTPSFSTPLPPELDPDPLGWGTPSSHASHEEQMQYTNPGILDQSTRLYGDANLENHAGVPPPTGMMSGQSIGFSASTFREATEFDGVTPLPLGEEADEYKYMQFINTKALQSEKSSDVRKSERESSVPMSLVSSREGLNPSTMAKILKAPVCPSSPDERSNAREVLEVPWMEGKMDAAQSPRENPVTKSGSGPKDALSGPPSLLSPLLTRTVVPVLRGRQIGSLVLEHEKGLQSPQQTEPKRQHTVESLLDQALRQ
ncbi:unnamed protein product [Calypogeia fissa]